MYLLCRSGVLQYVGGSSSDVTDETEWLLPVKSPINDDQCRSEGKERRRSEGEEMWRSEWDTINTPNKSKNTLCLGGMILST